MQHTVKAPLPIDAIADELASSLAAPSGQRVVLNAPTGSGKSTRVAQFLVDRASLPGTVIVLQPRRLAARMLARRVARERDCRLGEAVGYHVRLDRKESPGTRILFVTEGIFLRRVLGDPSLKGISAVVLDEFHERHLETDLGLALGLQIQRTTRPDLHLIVMSATLPGPELNAHLAPCLQLDCHGRTFPVEIAYRRARQVATSGAQTREPAWVTAARACAELHEKPGGTIGDTLVFMPGAFEIRRTIEELRKSPWSRALDILPLHGGLPAHEQDNAVADQPRNGGNRRPRIIVTTNIAETSITIPGVTAVVDSGLARVSSYDRSRGINTLHIRKISQASADQRAGRAGRCSPGRCLRLWDEKEHASRPGHETAEIHRIDLSQALLVLLAANTGDPRALPWLEKPHSDALGGALELLEHLGAIDFPHPRQEQDLAHVTPPGREMAKFPAHPRIARMLKEAAQLDCLQAAAICAAIISERDLFRRGRESSEFIDRHSERGDRSDFLPRIRALAAAEARRFEPATCNAMGIHAAAARSILETAEAHVRIARELGWAAGSDWRQFRDGYLIGRFVLAGFSDHVAARPSPGSNLCHLPGDRRGRLVRESVIERSENLLVATEIVEIEGRSLEVTMGLATAIDERLLEEVFPSSRVEKERTDYDPKRKRVIGMREHLFRGTILRSVETGTPDLDIAAELLADEVLAGRLVIKSWDTRAEEWINRVNFLADAMPEIELEKIDDEGRRLVLIQICRGATSQKTLKDRDVWGALRSWLSAAQLATLESCAPERITLPPGRQAKVTYGGDGNPRLSATIQDLFDLKFNPTIAAGRITLLVELLAPNRRPVQTTADIGSFWENGYPAIKSELRGRYPKHEWR
jgi:ATP-dependent helicase HrpB